MWLQGPGRGAGLSNCSWQGLNVKDTTVFFLSRALAVTFTPARLQACPVEPPWTYWPLPTFLIMPCTRCQPVWSWLSGWDPSLPGSPGSPWPLLARGTLPVTSLCPIFPEKHRHPERLTQPPKGVGLDPVLGRGLWSRLWLWLPPVCQFSRGDALTWLVPTTGHPGGTPCVCWRMMISCRNLGLLLQIRRLRFMGLSARSHWSWSLEVVASLQPGFCHYTGRVLRLPGPLRVLGRGIGPVLFWFVTMLHSLGTPWGVGLGSLITPLC